MWCIVQSSQTSPLTYRFGHAVMQMECNFDLQAPHRRLRLPPNWDYGTVESLERAFSSLNIMAPERSQMMDCVARWLDGLLTKFIARKGLLWGLQRAKYCLTSLQESQESTLRLLEDLRERIRADWLRERIGADQKHLGLDEADQLVFESAQDDEDEVIYETDLDDDDDDDEPGEWDWQDRFGACREEDFRDFWISPTVTIQDSYFIHLMPAGRGGKRPSHSQFRQ